MIVFTFLRVLREVWAEAQEQRRLAHAKYRFIED